MQLVNMSFYIAKNLFFFLRKEGKKELKLSVFKNNLLIQHT